MFFPVKRYEGLYEFDYKSNTVRSVDRYIGKRFHKGRILIPNIRTYGHLYYGISNKQKMECLGIHRIVAEYFHGPVPVGMEVCHNDGNPANNYPDNLRYDTKFGNARDQIIHKRTNTYRKGDKSKLSKTILQYDLNGNFINKYKGISETARINGYDQSCISRCLLGESKTSYGFIWRYE